MAITLGSNIASLRGQRQLSRTSEELGTVFQRLSSGQRINKASDDAAGLAIADSLNARSRIYNQGVRNLNDGQSLLSIADSAVEILGGIVIRLEELAEQSANGVYTNKQRKAMDDEAQALSKEFFRISKTTEFNGRRLLNGEFDTVNLQAGVGANAVLSAGVGGAIGTGSFDARVSFAVGDMPWTVAAGDINGDGYSDLVTANRNSDNLTVLLCRGDGTFASGVSYTVGDNPWSVTISDINRDGIVDLVNVDTDSDTTSVLFGRGDGTFGSRTSYSVSDSPLSVDTGDFNGDGILDLVTCGGSGVADVLLGKGDGTFGVSTSYTAASGSSWSIKAGDLNRDGNLDLVAVDTGAGAVSVLLGLGNGTFAAKVSYDLAGLSVREVALGDMNGDGILDVVTGSNNAIDIDVLLGRGDGTLNPTIPHSTAGGTHGITLGDFNGDGKLDLASASSPTDYIGVSLGLGNGSFDAARSFSVGNAPLRVVSGDFNGDGVLDLASADYLDDFVSVLLGDTRDGVAPLLPFSLKTLADARQAIPVFKRKREQLAEQRGEIGAFQSRLDVARNVLEVSSENFKAAESRIRDADIADESSRRVRLSILQQAASSILAQANQQPALALQLLRGGG